MTTVLFPSSCSTLLQSRIIISGRLKERNTSNSFVPDSIVTFPAPLRKAPSALNMGAP